MSYVILHKSNKGYFNYLNIEYTEIDGINYNDSYADFTTLLSGAEWFEAKDLAIEKIEDICYYTDCYSEDDFEVVTV